MSVSLVPVESFFSLAKAAELWDETTLGNKTFREQITERAELNRRLQNVLDSLPRPDIPLETAIDQGHLTEEQAAGLYSSLSGLLSERDYRRLVLYFPFELMPKKAWRAPGEKLKQAVEQFRHAYMEAWKSLLSAHDVRANFTDGDVLEIELRESDLPRVVKAAHLIPVLIEKGWMTVEDAERLAKEIKDQTLRDSVADALSAVRGTLKPEQPEAVKNTAPITEKRAAWLKKREREEAVDALSEHVSKLIIQGKRADASQEVLTEGIRKTVESIAAVDLEKARALYAQHRATLLKLWESDSSDVKDALVKTFRRFCHLGIVDEKQLAELNIARPKLEGPFSENLNFITNLVDMHGMVSSIESTRELSNLIYPVVLVYGSRLNGYGTRNSDIDVAVFVRPGTPFVIRQRLQELLARTFSHVLIPNVVEFWLEERNGLLRVRDFESPDVSLGESYWTHALFGAAWIGPKPVIRELCLRLLLPYLSDTSGTLHRQNARRLYLESLESASLQYRLMHNGYERFFARYGAPYPDSVDGKSAFWDSGYRWLATKLFLSKVFLPKLPAPLI
ncbi:MAG: hypothetical protein A2842_02620 [Candidatus Wildermuthbacteria bacterium RIFCSPHIGHO2_01_FULL_48_25]|nr:MAG: hypothetical protein A2842_02620 [Candidatus Wildermuthbacteria bacterium RIFCSPHIGHO2_01_FULL_48_25]